MLAEFDSPTFKMQDRRLLADLDEVQYESELVFNSPG